MLVNDLNNYIKGLTKHHIKYSLIFILLAISFVISNSKSASYQYQVNFDDSLSSAKIKLCVDGQQDDYLEIDRFKAYNFLVQKPLFKGKPIEIEGRFWNIKALRKDDCLNYEYSL